jgi:Flp pilus assembly protein TadG
VSVVARTGVDRRPADRGVAVVEHVVLVPVVLLLVLLGVQAAVWFHAANVAEHAAARGVSVASRRGVSNAAGAAEAATTVRDSGSTLLGVAVSGTSTVRATVTVAVHRVVPLFPASVTRSASEPEERYIPEDER